MTKQSKEEIFDSFAKKHMFTWDLDRFKKDYQTLFHVIMKSMEEYATLKARDVLSEDALDLLASFEERTINKERERIKKWCDKRYEELPSYDDGRELIGDIIDLITESK